MRTPTRRALLGATAFGVGAVLGYVTNSSPGVARARVNVSDNARNFPETSRAGGGKLSDTPSAKWPGVAPARAAADSGRVAPKVNMLERFGQEPRDAEFASQREGFLQRAFGGLLERVAPGVTIDEIECRTSTCVIEVSLPDDPWAHDVVSWLPWGDRRRTTDVASADDRLTVEIVAAYSPESLAHEYFEQTTSDLLHRIELGLVELHAQRLADAGVE